MTVGLRSHGASSTGPATFTVIDDLTSKCLASEVDRTIDAATLTTSLPFSLPLDNLTRRLNKVSTATISCGLRCRRGAKA